jgi:hypothetical protein
MSEQPEIPGWTAPSAQKRKQILSSVRSIAMVGVSANPARPSNFVATYLCSSSADFEVYFVNPTVDEILGQPCVPSLADLPVTPDLVDVFRKLDDVPAVAAEAVAVGAQVLWTQFGLWSPPAAQIALASGMELVMDHCLKIEHARFAGGLHLAGFDTGVIDSRRRR